MLSVNGHKPLDPLNPEDSFLGNAHVEFCLRSQIKILEIRGTIFWVVYYYYYYYSSSYYYYYYYYYYDYYMF